MNPTGAGLWLPSLLTQAIQTRVAQEACRQDAHLLYGVRLESLYAVIESFRMRGFSKSRHMHVAAPLRLDSILPAGSNVFNHWWTLSL